MANSSKGDASLAAGLILLAISCVLMGYGLCLMVHDLEGAGPLLGMGGAFAGFSTILIARSRSPSPPSKNG